MSWEQFVEVLVGRERYALPILEVHEIIRMQEITELPNSSQDVIGVTNLRGQIIPVVSVRQRFRMPDIEPTKSTRIVVVNHEQGAVGMIVDGVSQVVTFDDIQSAPESGRGDNVQFLRGMARNGETLVSILNLGLLLQESFS
ncbi:chemotaxis protein CheW [Alicyclobacillus dauci]|uniref:Chemotaxis protein CheW n=1 Tax=Alicyclobacillus dauci TaxID=1475485 RepID=A0ABY6Z0W3_9BACL|nr:chemotaxis protein CheW [Alicyclobacillus dauci]WAH36482.1 chemotaxis protein CheW [Alicyclobacillus dauci]